MDINQEYLTALLHFDGANGATTITDTSRAALGGVCIGTAALSTAQFKYGTAALKTGSANGNYLKLPASQAYNFGSGDFTVEAWIWPVSQGTDYGAVFGRWDAANSSAQDWLVWRAADGSVNVSLNGAQVVTGAAGDLPTGAFAHVALARAGTALQVWVGGVAKGSATFSGAINCTRGQINALGQSNFTAGSTFLEAYYDEVRVTVGVARYTAGFTPPAAAFEDYWNILLQLHFDKAYPITTAAGPTWLDSSRWNHPVTSASVADTLSTTTTKFGGGSCSHIGGNYLRVPDAPELNFGANDFTVEGWFYPTTVAAGQAGLMNKQNLLGNFGPFDVYRTGSQLGARFSTNGTSWTQTIAAAGTLVVNTWYHFALVRQGATATLYLNGTSLGSVTIGVGVALTNSTAYDLILGGYTGSNYFNGYLDEWRLVLGAAVYTGNFTPPSAAFTDPSIPAPALGLLRGSRTVMAQGLVTPVVNRKGPTLPYGSGRLLDYTWGGTASVAGKVTINNVAAVRRVFLIDLKSMLVIRSSWSDASGNYSFNNIDGNRNYMVIGRDYQQVYNAVVQDLITPATTAPAAFRPARRKLRFKAGGTGLSTNYPVLVRVGESTPNGVATAQAVMNADVICPVRYMPRTRDDVTDIVFTDTSGNQLDFWMETVYGTSPDRIAYYWVKLPGDLDAGPVDIYVQYNRGLTQTKTSNGANLFPTLFDDFLAYDSSKWQADSGVVTNSSVFVLNGNPSVTCWSLQAGGAEGGVRSVTAWAAGLEALATYTQFGYNSVAGAVQNQFGFVSGTGALNTVATLENLGDYQAGSRLAISGEATTNTNGRFTPAVGGGAATSGVLVSAQAGRLQLGRASDGSVVAQINNQTVMTRTGAGTGNANLAIYRGKNSQSGYVSYIDWVALRKYIPSGPPAMLQFAEEFM